MPTALVAETLETDVALQSVAYLQIQISINVGLLTPRLFVYSMFHFMQNIQQMASNAPIYQPIYPAGLGDYTTFGIILFLTISNF